MRRFFLILLISVFILFLLATAFWFYPVVKSIPEANLNLKQFLQPEKIAILCKAGGNTGPLWHIYQFEGVEELPTRDIDIIGNTPDNVLKYPPYIYYSTNKFLFIGNFKDGENLFIVDEWYFVDDIERLHTIAPYPKDGLNFFEIKQAN